MNSASLIAGPTPGNIPGSVVKWAMENPDAVRQIVDFINQIKSLEIVVVQNGQTTRFPLRLTGQNAIIEIQLPPSAP